MPYFESSLRATLSSATTGASRVSATSRQLTQAWPRAIEDVVGKHHGERLVADRRARLQHRMAEAERMPLFGDRDPRRIVAAPDEFEDVAFAAFFEMALELRVGLEMIDDGGLAGADDEDDFLDARGDRLLDDDLDRRRIDHRQNFLGDHLGRRQHPRAHPGREDDRLFYFHSSAIFRLRRAQIFDSRTSCADLHAMQSVVTGRAFSRSMPISPPHSSHCPYEPSSIRANASLIFVSSLRSRSRIRSRKLRSDSSAARSVGSAEASSDSWFMVPTARSDFLENVAFAAFEQFSEELEVSLPHG